MKRVKNSTFSGPIFVLGNPRSGTTLLRVILSSHSNICIPPETSFIVRLYNKYGNVSFNSEEKILNFVEEVCHEPYLLAERWQVSFDGFIEYLNSLNNVNDSYTYEHLCTLVYTYYSKIKFNSDNVIWGDKNNANLNYVELLNRLFPSAKFITIVRDGRAVLSSYQKLKDSESHKFAPDLPRKAHLVASKWITNVKHCSGSLTTYAGGRYYLIRYEDILDDFETTISKLCEFIGIKYEDNLENYYSLNKKMELEPSDYQWKENTTKPIDSSFADKWKKSLSSEDIRCFEYLAENQLSEYNYKLTQPHKLSLKHVYAALYFKYFSSLAKIKNILRKLKYNKIRSK